MLPGSSKFSSGVVGFNLGGSNDDYLAACRG
uniref:Uncharacterized protein n=1 Tax=Arundo donax TaxID=35708 RepID=A0A0A9C7Q3_ARUDO